MLPPAFAFPLVICTLLAVVLEPNSVPTERVTLPESGETDAPDPILMLPVTPLPAVSTSILPEVAPLPLDRTIVPPVDAAASPPDNVTDPLSLLAEDVSDIAPPLLTPDADCRTTCPVVLAWPDANVISPDSSDAGELNLTVPEDITLSPALNIKPPPVAAVESPALIAIEPPMPVFDEPTVNEISPLLCVPLAAPLESLIAPLEPLAELPDPTDTTPLEPDAPPCAVPIVTAPLALVALSPDTNVTDPPVSVKP